LKEHEGEYQTQKDEMTVVIGKICSRQEEYEIFDIFEGRRKVKLCRETSAAKTSKNREK